jgi:hypothetical protein
VTRVYKFHRTTRATSEAGKIRVNGLDALVIYRGIRCTAAQITAVYSCTAVSGIKSSLLSGCLAIIPQHAATGAYGIDAVLLFRLPFTGQPLGLNDLFGCHMLGDLIAIPYLI